MSGRLSSALSTVTTRRDLRAFPVTLGLVGAIFLSHFMRDGHNDQRIVQLACLLGAALYLAFRPQACASCLAVPVKVAVAGMFMLGAASAWQAFSPLHGFLELGLFALLLIVADTVRAEMASDVERGLQVVLTLVGICCLLYAFQIVVVYMAAFVSQIQPSEYAFAPNFSNQRFFNHAQTITLPFLILLYCRQQQGTVLRRIWFGLAAIWWALLFVLVSKGTVFATIAASGAVLVLMRRAALPYLSATLQTAGCGLVVFLVFFVGLPVLAGFHPFTPVMALGDPGAGHSASARLTMWERAVTYGFESPWLGLGPMHFAHHAADLGIAAHPHNWVVQLFSEWGIPACLGAMAAVAWGMRSLLRASARLPGADRSARAVGGALLATGLAIILDGLVSGLLVMPVAQLLIALYLGCAAGWVQARTGPRAADGRRPGWLARVIPLLIAVAVIASAVGISGDPLPADTGGGMIVSARFWLNGLF